MVTSRRVQCQEISYVSWCKAMQGGNGRRVQCQEISYVSWCKAMQGGNG